MLSTSKTTNRIDRSLVRKQLESLPEAQYDYESRLPEEEEEEKVEEEILDAEEIERQIREEEAAIEREELARRSEVMKRSLPRGSVIPSRFFLTCDAVETALKQEMNAIVRYEDYKYPTAESNSKYAHEVTLPVLSHEDQISAEMLILEEAEDLRSGSAPLSSEQLESLYTRVWEKEESDLVYDPESKSVVAMSGLNEEERVRCLKHRFANLEKQVAKQSKLVARSENKLNVLMGGYVARQKALLSRFNGLHRDLDLSRINYLCFSKLAVGEQTSRSVKIY